MHEDIGPEALYALMSDGSPRFRSIDYYDNINKKVCSNVIGRKVDLLNQTEIRKIEQVD